MNFSIDILFDRIKSEVISLIGAKHNFNFIDFAKINRRKCDIVKLKTQVVFEKCYQEKY